MTYRLTENGSSEFEKQNEFDEIGWFGYKALLTDADVPQGLRSAGWDKLSIEPPAQYSNVGVIELVQMGMSPIELKHMMSVVDENGAPFIGDANGGTAVGFFGYPGGDGPNLDSFLKSTSVKDSEWQGNMPHRFRGIFGWLNIIPGYAETTVGGSGGEDSWVWLRDQAGVCTLPSTIVRSMNIVAGALNNHTALYVKFQVRRANVIPTHVREARQEKRLAALQEEVNQLRARLDT